MVTANDLQSLIEMPHKVISLTTFTFNLVHIMMIAVKSDGYMITKYSDKDQWYTAQSPHSPPGVQDL